MCLAEENLHFVYDQLSFVYGFHRKLSSLCIIHCVSENVGLSPHVYWDVTPYQFVFFCVAAVQIGRTPPHCWGIQITIRNTYPLGFSWKSDQLFAEVPTYTKHDKRKRRTFFLVAEFKPAILVIKRQQSYALDDWASGSAQFVNSYWHWHSELS